MHSLADTRMVRNSALAGTDPGILSRIAAGEATAVDNCLATYGGLVWALARRYCPSPEDAEDAVQEIFLDLWRSAKRYDATMAAEATFVAMIARRRLLDRRRKMARLPGFSDLPEELAAADNSQQNAVWRLDAGVAEREIARLKPEQQQALRLAIWEDLSHSEIAERMNMPLGTVKSFVRRGLLQVRKALEMSRAGLRAGAGRGQ